MSPQQRRVWSLVRTARNALEQAIELENDIETERRMTVHPFKVGNDGYVDPLGGKLDGILDEIKEVLA